MVTREIFSARLSSVMFCDGLTRVPSSSTRTPSTYTQPRSMYSSASRREHRPRSDMSFDTRIFSTAPATRWSTAGAAGGAAVEASGIAITAVFGIDEDPVRFEGADARERWARFARVDGAVSGRLREPAGLAGL